MKLTDAVREPDCYCPKCGGKGGVWRQVSEGDYYLGQWCVCVFCGNGGNEWHCFSPAAKGILAALRDQKPVPMPDAPIAAVAGAGKPYERKEGRFRILYRATKKVPRPAWWSFRDGKGRWDENPDHARVFDDIGAHAALSALNYWGTCEIERIP